jgi:hypothetical protein
MEVGTFCQVLAGYFPKEVEHQYKPKEKAVSSS